MAEATPATQGAAQAAGAAAPTAESPESLIAAGMSEAAGGAAKPTPAPTGPPTPPPTPAPDGYVKAADVQRMIEEGIARSAKSQQQQRAAADVRQQFIQDRMSNLPPALARLLPDTADRGQLEQAAAGLAAEFGDWLKRSGLKVPDVGGRLPGGGLSPMQARFTAAVGNRSPVELIAEGMADAKKQGQG